MCDEISTQSMNRVGKDLEKSVLIFVEDNRVNKREKKLCEEFLLLNFNFMQITYISLELLELQSYMHMIRNAEERGRVNDRN